MKIKICGIRRDEDAEYLNEFMPDYAGFIFAPPRRYVAPEKATELRARLDKKIKTVGVFVNEDIALVKNLAQSGVIDIVQLHGDEDNEYIARLNVSVPVIKVQRVAERKDIKHFNSDFYLFDTYKKGVYGGTGESFDWSVLSDIDKPYFLAGGLNEDNISEALKTNAFALDVSSGVETDGVKDREKIKKIIQIVRNFDE